MLRSVCEMHSEGACRLTGKWSYLVLSALLLMVAFLLLLSVGCQGSIIEGVVDHKAVTGVKNDTSFTILINARGDSEPWILVKDRDYEEYFLPQDQHAIVSQALEDLMRQKYSEVNYFVNVKVASSGDIGTQPYRVSREIFNQMRVGSEVRFRASGAELPEITKLLMQPV